MKLSKKEKNKLAHAKHLFTLEKAANPNQCYCVYDDYGKRSDSNFFDMDNPVDFYHSRYKCLKCGNVGQHFPVVAKGIYHPTYNWESASKAVENPYVYYSHNHDFWKKDIDYVLFDNYNKYIGIGHFIGIIKATVSTAGDNPSPPQDVDVAAFQVGALRVSFVTAIPKELFNESL